MNCSLVFFLLFHVLDSSLNSNCFRRILKLPQPRQTRSATGAELEGSPLSERCSILKKIISTRTKQFLARGRVSAESRVLQEEARFPVGLPAKTLQKRTKKNKGERKKSWSGASSATILQYGSACLYRAAVAMYSARKQAPSTYFALKQPTWEI